MTEARTGMSRVYPLPPTETSTYCWTNGCALLMYPGRPEVSHVCLLKNARACGLTSANDRAYPFAVVINCCTPHDPGR
jgi:hypothetical protein